MPAPAIDTSVLVGFPAARKYLGLDGHPSRVYLRAVTARINGVDNLLAASANPEKPIPTEAWTGGLAASPVIGGLAGLVPALRAARLSPTRALWSV